MRRKERVQEAIRREMGRIIQEELHDPRIRFVTVTRVEVSDDLRHAKIYYSVLGTDKEEKDTAAAMNSAMGFIRSIIAKELNLRFAPEIILRQDNSIKYSIEIQKELEGLKNEPYPPLENDDEKSRKEKPGESHLSLRPRKDKKGRKA